jgi:hypothetical protein
VPRAFVLVASFVALLAACRATIELDPAMSLGACHPVGSACGDPSECCSGLCDSFCAAVDGCRPAGESCAAGTECCSHVCASDGQGRVICQQLGGCRVAGELCTSDRDCCGGSSCTAMDATSGIGRCALGQTCSGAGEICRVGGDPLAMRDCCTDGALRFLCRDSDVRGVDRCLLATADCEIPGSPCTAPGDCCNGRCVPDAAGVLMCSESCVGGVGRCTSDADCCSGTCGFDAHCALDMRTCGAIAAACAEDTDCCSGLCEDGACGSPLF